MELPEIGLGTWELTGREGREVIRRAIDLGYRHLDTAQLYENEREVGEAIAEADVPREELFVATKVHHRTMPAASYDAVLEAAADSLERLGLERLDLLYVHWPVAGYDPRETLPAFDELVDEGVIDHVGLCNCTPAILDEARDALDAPLFAHQVECHPLLPQAELRAYANEHDHHLVAYSPLANGELFGTPELERVAEKRDVSVATVALAWLRSKGVASIPRTTSDAHLRENLASREFELEPADVEAIDAIDRERRVIDPDVAPWN